MTQPRKTPSAGAATDAEALAALASGELGALGIIYDREGDPARAALATAERSNLEDQPKTALANAQLAMKGIPPGTPDYLRAQDIVMVSRAQLAKKDKKYREPKDQ